MKHPDIKPRTHFLAANWRELTFAVLGIAVFFVIGKWGMHWIDPTAGTTDFGAVDILAFSAASLLVGYIVVWTVLRIAFKTIQHYLDTKGFRKEFSDLMARDRILITLAVIAFNLWAFIAFARIVAGAK